MPAPSVPDLPELHPDLHWLFDLDLADTDIARVHAALEHYVRRNAPPPGATTCFTLSNIFSSPKEANFWQKQYDYCDDTLANAKDIDLLDIAPCELDEPWFPERDRQEYKRHKDAVRHLCTRLHLLWDIALCEYEMGLSIPRHRQGRLYFDPHLERLPTKALISTLDETSDTRSFLIVTARHELGYLYEKVKWWHKQAHEVGTTRDLTMSTLPPCLDSGDVGLLSARMRGYQHLGLERVDSVPWQNHNLPPVPRTDAPSQWFSPDSSLAMLYWHFSHWYKAVYWKTVNAARCSICGIVLPPRKATGRHPKYCSEPCRRQAEYGHGPKTKHGAQANGQLAELKRALVRANKLVSRLPDYGETGETRE